MPGPGGDLAACHGGEDGDPLSRFHGRMDAVPMSDVLVVDEDVHEPPERSAVVEEPASDRRVVGAQALQDLADRGAVDLEGRRAPDLLAEGPGDAHRGHLHTTSARASSVAGMTLVGANRDPNPSSVFRPIPVTYATTVSSARMTPCPASWASAPMVTPPAVSVKIPSVRARRPTASTMSSSDTSATAPPDFRHSWSAYHPSAGSPMASDFAMVCGRRTGRTSSAPDANAAATGLHPVAWAPEMRTFDSSVRRPSASSCRNAAPILVSS